MVKITADSFYSQLINYKTWSKLSSRCETSKEIIDSSHEQQPIKTVWCETALVLTVLILGFFLFIFFKQRTLYKDFKLALGFSYSIPTTYQVPIIFAEPFFFKKGALPVTLQGKEMRKSQWALTLVGCWFFPGKSPWDTLHQQQTRFSCKKSSFAIQTEDKKVP